MIRVLVPRECRPGETRVAATPETVRRLAARGCALQVERGAGQASGFEDDASAMTGQVPRGRLEKPRARDETVQVVRLPGDLGEES